MSRRDHKGLWQPGKSGNPSGRPKAAHDIQALARAYGPDAIEALARNLTNDNPAVVNAAAQALLDRGYGKPVQTNNVTVTQNVRQLTDDELHRSIAVLAGRKAQEERSQVTH